MVEIKVQEGWLLGEKLDSATGDGQNYSFKGIPYAEPPVGKLRFKAPRPPLPWDGVRKATEHGNKCPQIDVVTRKIQLGSEDCLFLNVYTPDLKPTTPLPVMVFIYGSGFISGCANSKNYEPDLLIRHGIIFVTFNYRLEVLGFLCLDTEDVPGNAGLKDQVAALKWVRNNIENFGGDPDNVTIVGHNAGAVCTALHILSPMSKGLFKRAIPMSGVPLCDWAIPFVPQKRAFVLGKQLGLETDDPNVLLQFLQETNVENLINTNPTVLSFEEHNNNMLKMYHFTPVVEKDFGQEQFLTEDPLVALKHGKINDVDVLLGHTSEEAIIEISFYEEYVKKLILQYNRYPELLVPRKIQIKCTPDQMLDLSKRIHDYYFKGKPVGVDTMKEYIKFCSHSGFVYDINSFMSKLQKTGDGRRFMYQFSCMSNRNIHGKAGMKYGIKGASHIDDLMYIMYGSRYKFKFEKNTREYNLVQLVTTVFTNFAKYGNPTPDASLGVIWPEYDCKKKAFVDIGDTLIVDHDSMGEAYQFWRTIYEELGLEY